MATSINGYPVLRPGSPALKYGRVPGTNKKILLRADVLPIFLAILSEIDRTVIDLDGGPLDGHSYRAARYTRKWSNHSSGTAADFRYDKFPADRRVHMTKAQRAQMHALLNKYKVGLTRIFIWGGDWTVGRTMDEMHLEIARGVSVAQVRAAMSKLGIHGDGTFATAPRPGAPKPATPAPKPAPKPVSTRPVVSLANVQPGKSNLSVKAVEVALMKEGFLAANKVNGTWDIATTAAYQRWQKKLGFSGSAADGRPGLSSLSKLAQKYNYQLVK